MDKLKASGLNDFVIKIANVNGTGSASANKLLMKAIFRLGVPVAGKNYFPSNIQGLPTWYEIRASRDGYRGRSPRVDIMVAMNAQTYEQDLADVTPGGVLLYDATWPREKMLLRDDVTVLGVPFAQMCNTNFDNVRTRVLMKNIAYVGALAALLDIDTAIIRSLLEETFAAKPALVAPNMQALELGYDYAKINFACPLETRVAPMDATDGHIVIDGNTTAALGCVYAGATFGAWYPITPSTSLMDAFQAFCRRFRTDPETGKNRFCVLQAEDEMGAIGMAVGAGWNGARAFTSTSGPGISLMSEFLGFAYFTEIPLVLFDIQRGGPSTGLPTRTQQSDLLSCAYASHGDTRHVLLFPADPEECFELSVIAFDLAERLQTPVIVMSDLDIGMNDWMCRELGWDDAYQPDRGRVLDEDALDAIEAFQRYRDDSGDGICHRSYPGVHPKGAYFTRGSGHTEGARYSEDPAVYEQLMDRLARKFETAAGMVPAAALRKADIPTKSGIVSFGSCDAAIGEAVDRLSEEGMAVDYLRVRAFPFGSEVRAFLNDHDRIFVVEQNRDAQLKALLCVETGVASEKLVSILHYNGIPVDWHCIYAEVSEQLKQVAAA